MDRLARLRKEHARAVRASERASEARFNLPPGSSRARVTSANAKWARLAEHRDRLAAEITTLETTP